MTRALDGFGRLAVASLAAAVALHPVVTPDLWWHLASGRWVVENGTVPRTDPFSYTMTDHAWVNLQWLGDVVLVRLYSVGGADLLVLGKAIVWALLAVVLFGASRRHGAGPVASTIGAALAVLASAERTMVRPELASLLGLAFVLHRLPAIRAGKADRWWLPLVVALWINVHSLAFLAPLLLLGHAVLATLERRWSAPFRSPELAGRPAALGLAGALGAGAMLLNPYGIAAWTFPATLFRRIDGGGDVFERILEFAPPAADAGDPALRFFWILLALLGVTFLLRPGRPPLGRLLSVLPLLGLAWLARRNVPLFAVAAAPVLAVQLTELGAGRAAGLVRRSAPLAPVAALATAVAVLAGASPTLLGLNRDRGLGVTPGLFPERELATLEAAGTRGPLFNELDFGGYVTWRNPQLRTFIDGRLEVAGPEWFAEWVDVHLRPAAWERAERRWRFEALLVQHSSAGNAALLRHLLSSGRWEGASWSGAGALLLRPGVARPAAPGLAPSEWDALLDESRGPEPHAGRALAGITDPLHRWLSPSTPSAAIRRAMRRANLCLTLGDVPAARLGYDRVLARAPRDPEAVFNRGLCDLREGNRDAALRRWRDALPHLPRGRREAFERAIAGLPPGG